MPFVAGGRGAALRGAALAGGSAPARSEGPGPCALCRGPGENERRVPGEPIEKSIPKGVLWVAPLQVL